MSVAEQAGAHGPGEKHHPTPVQYVKVAVVLAIATAAEVVLFYIEQLPDGALIGLLMFFMIFKFAMVALWFMHLRFDSRILRRVFVTGIVLACSVYIIVLLTFGILR